MALRRINWPVTNVLLTSQEVKYALRQAFPDISDTTLLRVVCQGCQLDSNGCVTDMTTAEQFEYWLERSLQENNVFRFEGQYWEVKSIFSCIQRRDTLVPEELITVTSQQENLLGCLLSKRTLRQWEISIQQEIINLAKGYPPQNLDVLKTIQSFKRRYDSPACEYVLSPLDICEGREQLLQVSRVARPSAFKVLEAKDWLARNLSWLQTLHETTTVPDSKPRFIK